MANDTMTKSVLIIILLSMVTGFLNPFPVFRLGRYFVADPMLASRAHYVRSAISLGACTAIVCITCHPTRGTKIVNRAENLPHSKPSNDWLTEEALHALLRPWPSWARSKGSIVTLSPG
jgi:hypothetical protein